MVVEIKGFNEAYENARNIETVKKYARQAMNKKVKALVEQLVAEGTDIKMAKAVAKSMAEGGLL